MTRTPLDRIRIPLHDWAVAEKLDAAQFTRTWDELRAEHHRSVAIGANIILTGLGVFLVLFLCDVMGWL